MSLIAQCEQGVLYNCCVIVTLADEVNDGNHKHHTGNLPVGFDTWADPELIRQIEAGEVHPAMAVFGLWQDGDQTDRLVEEIYADRLQQDQRGEVEL